MAMEISLPDINSMDEISIRTQNSEYYFRVTEPNLCCGLLRGGPLGDQPHEALFSGAIFPKSFGRANSTRLAIGARALFYVAINDRLKLLTTSLITQLAFGPVRNDLGPAEC
jgi:hypothetical protein